MSTITQLGTSYDTSYANKTTGATLSATEYNTALKTLRSKIDEVITAENNNLSGGGTVDDSTLLGLLKLTNTSGDFASGVETYVSETEQEAQTNATDTSINKVASIDKETFYKRGAAAYFSLGSSLFETTDEKQLVDVSGTTETAKGDRVRFGSWYVKYNAALTVFNCSHEFIELVNSGTFDYPLSDVCLGIIYQSKEGTPTDSSYYSILEIPLGIKPGTTDEVFPTAIKAKSSYLIRGSELVSKDDQTDGTYIKINNNYDIDITPVLTSNNINLYQAVGFLLYNTYLKGYLTNEENGTTYLKLFASTPSDTDKSTWTYLVNAGLVDVVLFNSTAGTNLTGSALGSKLFGANPVYDKVENAIIKDQYSLDPAKQAFKSLTGWSKEASQSRLAKVNSEVIPLGNYEIQFPHSKPTQPVTKYAPKSSGQNKNVLTDKTSPDFNKPNMVTVSFGIDAQTTRCFNWFSMSRLDEYVWIRKIGDSEWTRFESYKSGDGTDSSKSDSNTRMHRVEFTKDIINSVYKRMDNVFPGDSTYTYRVHKCIVYVRPALNSDTPITYQYMVGKGITFGNTIIPDAEGTSDIQTFTIYPKDWTPKIYHVTDQLGFGWMEYQEWAAAAEEINNKITKECTTETKLFPILINTGDMTLNGTRVNEWIDYYNAGKSLFNHIEQMNVVGNNDLCNALSEVVLGNGNDNGKSSPYYFHAFYCYEVENQAFYTGLTGNDELWNHPVIYNNKYIPSMYYFYFGNYGYLMVNSELTAQGCAYYFGAGANDADTLNLYTGNLVATTTYTTYTQYSLALTLSNWIDKLTTKVGSTNTSKIIVACHEMPYTVTTIELSGSGYDIYERALSYATSTKKYSLVGSHLNRLTATSAYKDCNYWFSKLLLDKGIKLCIGGHKHTYAITWPICEQFTSPSADTVDPSKYSIVKRDAFVRSSAISSNTWPVYNAETDSDKNFVVYFMLLATGYKLTSNKELPSRDLVYSRVVPATSGTAASPSADNSQKYPMYGTYEYKSDGIYGSIFRVINIKNESMNGNAIKITEFSEQANSSKKMYSELLLITSQEIFYDNTNKVYDINGICYTSAGIVTTKPETAGGATYTTNYWLIPEEDWTSCVGYGALTSGNGVIDKQRCIKKDGKYYIYPPFTTLPTALENTNMEFKPDFTDCTVKIDY